MESRLPNLLIPDGNAPKAGLQRSRSEAVLKKAPGRKKLVVADADINPLMSRRNLSRLERNAKISNDEEMFSSLSQSQKRLPRASSTSALEKAGGRKKQAYDYNDEDVCPSLKHSQKHWPRPPSTPSLTPQNPIARSRFLAPLNREAYIDSTGQKGSKANYKASTCYVMNHMAGKTNVSMFTGRPYKEVMEDMEDMNSKLQFRRPLSSMQVREHLLSSPKRLDSPNLCAEEYRESMHKRHRLQSIDVQTSQAEQKAQQSYDGIDERAIVKTKNKNGIDEKAMTTVSVTKPTLSHHGQESEAVDALQVRRSSKESVFKATKELNCPLDTTKDAQVLFDRYAIDDQRRGYLDYQKFGEIVLHIMNSTGQQLSEEEMKKKIEVSWREADRNYNGQVDFDEFTIWYSSWGFQQELLLSPQQILNRDFAKKYDLSIADVDSVHAKFQVFDEDGSGMIEFPEFEKLLYKLMKIPRGQELPANRLKHLWKEIDIDGSGGVDFDEFLQWYIKYFDMKGNSDATPIEQFYQSVRPNLGRTM
jgi:Ca2+-binding EF-hand superfamily protein